MEEISRTRLFKPAAMFFLALIATRYLSGSFEVALAVATIPLFLGFSGVLTEAAYTGTALLVVSALTWAALPQGVHHGVAHLLSSAFQDDPQTPDPHTQSAKLPTS